MLKGASYIKKLTKRLEAMLDMIGRCDELIDIGADHGYLCAAVVMRGIAKHAYAADEAATEAKAEACRYKPKLPD